MSQPLLKKAVNKYPKYVPCFKDLLRPFNDLPTEIFDKKVFDFIERNKVIHPFYYNAYRSGVQARKISAKRILKLLKNTKSKKVAIENIKDQFDSFPQRDKKRIVIALFEKGKIVSRLAVSLLIKGMDYDNVFDKWIINELITDGTISNAAKRACIELILDKVDNTMLLNMNADDLLSRGLPYSVLCLKGIRPIDKLRLQPLDYLSCLIVSNGLVSYTSFMSPFSVAINRYIKNQHYRKIRRKHTWVPSIISLKPTQTTIELCAKHNKTECVRWIYALDRTIQQEIRTYTDWSALADNECVSENYERAMTVFYSFVVEFLQRKGLLDEESVFGCFVPEDQQIPF